MTKRLRFARQLIRQRLFRPNDSDNAMRYVIAIAIMTGLIIWDGFQNDGHYLDLALRQVAGLLRSVGLA